MAEMPRNPFLLLKPLGDKMKRSILIFLALWMVPNVAFAERGTLPPGDSNVYTKDLSVVNLPATYGAAGNSYATGLIDKSNVCIINGAATKVYATTATASNCTGATDKWVVPASSSACFEWTRVNSRVCLRSASGTLSSGTIDVAIW